MSTSFFSKILIRLPLISKKAYKYYFEKDASSASSSISFYVIFSLAPLLITITAVLGIVLGQDSALHFLINQLGPHVSQSGIDFILNVFEYQKNHETSNIIAIIIATCITFFTSFSVMYEIKKSLEEFWDPEIPKDIITFKRTWKNFFEFTSERLTSLILIPIIIAAILLSIIFGTVTEILTKLFPFAGFYNLFTSSFDTAILFVLLFGLFTFMYRFLTDYRMKWKSSLLGSLIASALFILGKLFVELYITEFIVVSQYGAASSLFAFMAWIYYSAQIFFVGAAFCLGTEKSTH